MHQFLSVLGALSALSVLGVAAQEGLDAACLDGCRIAATEQFPTFGCTSAEDRPCLCVNDQYKYSVRDCSTSGCGTTESQVMDWLSGGFCVGYSTPDETEGATTSAAEPAPTTAVEPAPTTAAEPAPTTVADSAPTTTAIEEGETSAPAPTAESTEAPINMETSVTSESTAASETSGAAATQTAPGEEDQKEDDEDGDEAAAAGGGLSQGAAVGIGVGVAVCVVAVAVVAVVLLLRNRKRKQQLASQANQARNNFPRPMPDSGRSYASVDHGPLPEKRGGESIELTSHRYEDMVPRATPRTMV